MLLFRSLADVPEEYGPTVLTFGKFDGVHLGHRRVLDAVVAAAAERALPASVLTFDRNPLAVIDPERTPDAISSTAQRRELLEECGIDAVLELEFDDDFRTQSAGEFVRKVVVDALHADGVLVGPDLRFGAGGAGDFATLSALGAEHGFTAQQLPALDDDTERISSTRIRELLAAGDVAGAAEMLGRAHSVRSVVVHGQKRGRALGYPTANCAPDLEGMIPADGVYAGYLTVTDGAGDALQGVRMPAAVSIGNNPTFDGVPARQVEAYVLDEDLDLYDRIVTVEFAERIRGMSKFDSLDDLVARMGLDIAEVRELTA